MARGGRPPQERREAVGVENHIFSKSQWYIWPVRSPFSISADQIVWIHRHVCVLFVIELHSSDQDLFQSCDLTDFLLHDCKWIYFFILVGCCCVSEHLEIRNAWSSSWKTSLMAAVERLLFLPRDHVLHTIFESLPRLISIPNRLLCVKENCGAGGRDIQTEKRVAFSVIFFFQKRNKTKSPIFTASAVWCGYSRRLDKSEGGGDSINYQTYLLFTTAVCVCVVGAMGKIKCR